MICPCCAQSWNPKVDTVFNDTAIISGRAYRLSKIEMDIYCLLRSNVGKLVEYDRIETFWAVSRVSEAKVRKTMQVTICNLRKKLKGSPVSIEAVESRGYVLKCS